MNLTSEPAMETKRLPFAHPVRDINTPLLSNELQYTTVSEESLFFIAQFKQHRIGNVESSKFLKGRRRHDNLAAMFHLHAVLCRKNHRVASKLLPKSSREPHSPHCIEASTPKSIEILKKRTLLTQKLWPWLLNRKTG